MLACGIRLGRIRRRALDPAADRPARADAARLPIGPCEMINGAELAPATAARASVNLWTSDTCTQPDRANTSSRITSDATEGRRLRPRDGIGDEVASCRLVSARASQMAAA